METTFDSRVQHLPPVVIIGGSIGNFDKNQASFSGDLGCADSTAFAKAVEQATPAPVVPLDRHFRCDSKCKGSADECIKQLSELISKPDATVDTADKLRVQGQAEGSAPRFLFPGKQQCGGCSRSPAWDALEVPSPWFTGTTPAPATNLSKLLGGPATSAFALVDTWEKKTVTRLEGTRSHATETAAWSLTNCEVQCSDGESRAEESCRGDVGTFRYQGSVPLLGCAQDDLAYQIFAVGSLRSARVLNVVMYSAECYHVAAKLLEMRDSTIASGLDSRVGALRTSRKLAVFDKIQLRGPLPPKLSGYATCPTAAYRDLCDRERLSGAMLNTSLFALSLLFNRGAYGGSISGLWALMDSAFMFDYSMDKCNANLGQKIKDTFTTARSFNTGNVELQAHILDIVTVLGCTYTTLQAKAELEDARQLSSHPCVVIWDDLTALARFKVADAAFSHVYYDSRGDEASLVMAGLGCAIHDLIDLGPDVACGEISNIVPSLTRGDLSFGPLRSVYVGMVAALDWYATNDPFDIAGLAILLTHWWQLSNLRHRPVVLMSRVAPSAEYAVCPERLGSPPSFHTLTYENGIKYETGQAVIDSQRTELDRIAELAPEYMQRLINAPVRPVLDYADGRDTRLPIEATFCAEVLEACLSHHHSEKIRLLWRLTLVMWKCGAMWAAVLASTQYAHQGLTNGDRLRDDLDEGTWA